MHLHYNEYNVEFSIQAETKTNFTETDANDHNANKCNTYNCKKKIKSSQTKTLAKQKTTQAEIQRRTIA